MICSPSNPNFFFFKRLKKEEEKTCGWRTKQIITPLFLLQNYILTSEDYIYKQVFKNPTSDVFGGKKLLGWSENFPSYLYR